MTHTVINLEDVIMQEHGCSRRQANEYLHNDLDAHEFFSNASLTGYVPYPEDELSNDLNDFML